MPLRLVSLLSLSMGTSLTSVESLVSLGGWIQVLLIIETYVGLIKCRVLGLTVSLSVGSYVLKAVDTVGNYSK